MGNKRLQLYSINTRKGGFIRVLGRPIRLARATNLQFFIHHPIDERGNAMKTYWRISELTSGKSGTPDKPTQKDAIEFLNTYFKNNGTDVVEKDISRSIEEYGKAPAPVDQRRPSNKQKGAGRGK